MLDSVLFHWHCSVLAERSGRQLVIMASLQCSTLRHYTDSPVKFISRSIYIAIVLSASKSAVACF